MFESVCMRHARLYETQEYLDFGFLAEALLFYQNVHLIVDYGMLEQLVRECQPRPLIELMEEGFLKVSYTNKTASIENIKEFGVMRPNTFWVAGGSWDLDQVAPSIFAKVTGAPGYGRRMGRRFAELASTIDYGPEFIRTWRADMHDADFVCESVIVVLKVLAPSYRLPRGFRFEVVPDREDFFRVETNLDFPAITECFYARMGRPGPAGGKPLEAGNLLMYIVDARTELIHASQDNAELAANPANAAILGVKWREVLHTRGASEHEIGQFQQYLLANGNEIGESIVNRYRTWPDLLDLLRRARDLKFKDWLKERNPDSSLIGDYYKALIEKTWVEGLPAKPFRFLICTLAGLAAPPPISIALSAADTFLVDRWLGGWKPNTFVNGPLKRFARLD